MEGKYPSFEIFLALFGIQIQIALCDSYLSTLKHIEFQIIDSACFLNIRSGFISYLLQWIWFTYYVFFSELPRRNAKILGKSQPIFGSICRRFEYQPQWWSVRGIKLTSVFTKKLSQHQQNICAVIFPIHFLRHKAKSDAFHF